jgi:hypothetical protein
MGSDLGRALIILGAAILLVGVFVALGGKLTWLGRLPGDIVWRRGGTTVYLPIATCLLLSLLLTLVLSLLRR